MATAAGILLLEREYRDYSVTKCIDPKEHLATSTSTDRAPVSHVSLDYSNLMMS